MGLSQFVDLAKHCLLSAISLLASLKREEIVCSRSVCAAVLLAGVRSYSRHKVSLTSFSAAVGAFQTDTSGDTGISARKTADSGTPPPLA